MLRFTYIIAILIYSLSLSGQATIGSGRLDVTETNNDLLYGTTDITGDPYLDNDFSAATVFFTDGTSRNIEKAKFEICSQKLLVVQGGKEMNVNDAILNGFSLNIDGVFRFFFKFGIDGQIQYLERLAEGDYTLFKSHRKKFNPSKQSDQLQYGDTDYKKPYFSNLSTNYYAFNADKLTEFKPSKKGVLDIVPKKKQKSLANAIKVKKFKVGTDKGLIALFDHLNK